MWPSVSVWAQGFPTPLRVNYSKLPDEWGGGEGVQNHSIHEYGFVRGGISHASIRQSTQGSGNSIKREYDVHLFIAPSQC